MEPTNCFLIAFTPELSNNNARGARCRGGMHFPQIAQIESTQIYADLISGNLRWFLISVHLRERDREVIVEMVENLVTSCSVFIG